MWNSFFEVFAKAFSYDFPGPSSVFTIWVPSTLNDIVIAQRFLYESSINLLFIQALISEWFLLFCSGSKLLYLIKVHYQTVSVINVHFDCFRNV